MEFVGLEADVQAGGLRYRASGSGRIWKCTTLLVVPFPVSLWNIVRVPQVVHTPLPFHPVLGSSMRPSMPLAKKPVGYGTRNTWNFPSTRAIKESDPLPVAIGTFLPMPHVTN